MRTAKLLELSELIWSFSHPPLHLLQQAVSMRRKCFGTVKQVTSKQAHLMWGRAFLVDLETRLKPLERSGQIDAWSEHQIRAGANRKREIERHLRESDIILLLVSPDFLASDHCQMIQQQAIELHEAKKTYSVIPIILRPVDWKQDPISKLKSLPQNEIPVSKWKNKDEALLDVVLGIKEVVVTLLSEPQKQSGTREGVMFTGHYPANGYRWDNDLRPAPGLVKQESMPDAPWLVSQAIGILEIIRGIPFLRRKMCYAISPRSLLLLKPLNNLLIDMVILAL
jgi:hypothetical protein